MKVEILVVPGPVLPDLEGIFESRGPPVHNWHGGRAVVNGLDGAQLAVTSSRFSVGGAIYRSDGVRTSASGASELSQDAALA